MAGASEKKPVMPNFSEFTNEQVLQYLDKHFHEMDAAQPEPDYLENLRRGLDQERISLEKWDSAFAIVAHANRKPRRLIDPRADLIILFVKSTSRGNGIGSQLLDHVKRKFMADQGMILQCSPSRTAFFEKAGFVDEGRNEDTGLHHMYCPPIQ